MSKVFYGFSFNSSNDAEVGNNKSTFESPSSTRLINDSKPPPTAALHSQLLGNFPGFSIKPLATSERPPQTAAPSRTPIRPAPTAPLVPVASAPKQNETVTANGSVAAEKRLQISRPVLDATTSSTARELGSLPPLKPAPPVPVIAASTTATTTAPTTPTATTTTTADNKSGGAYPTLRRITSFMKNQMLEEKKSAAAAPRANAKFTDRERLKNLEISEPILQNEINVPAEPLPLEADQRRAVVLRAHSLRAADASKHHRPSVHAGFGSMRRSTAAKHRPTSGAPAPPPLSSGGASCPARPTSPPPPLPDPSYQQRRSPVGGVRPARPTDEDDGSELGRDDRRRQSSDENIYSVIDENPVVVAIDDRDDGDDEDSGAYKVPRPLESSLLGEIVSAIQERNNESIYTNKRPDELQQQQQHQEQQTYENVVSVVKPPSPATGSSSGYERPVDVKSRRAAYDRPDLVKNCDENRSPTTMMMNRSPDVLDAKKQPTAAEKPTVASIKPLAGGTGVKPAVTATVGLKKKLSDRRQPPSTRTGGVADIQRRFENAAGAAPKKPPVASKPTAAR